MTTTVLLAGSTGMLGNRVAEHLLDQPDVTLRLLLRSATPSDADKAMAIADLVARGAEVVVGDVTEPAPLAAATVGVDVVVSALQGRRSIILDGQVALAEAAASNGVRRFVPSDFALDLFAAPDGAPQFDLRKQADRAIDALPLEVVHILNGGFLDMMVDPSGQGLVDLEHGVVTFYGTGDEPINLTTVNDTAHFTAKVAVDPADLSGVHYLSGAETTFNEITAESERHSGVKLTRNVLGDVQDLRKATEAADDPWSVLQQWYFLAMLTVPPFPRNDNERYPDVRPIGLREHLSRVYRDR